MGFKDNSYKKYKIELCLLSKVLRLALQNNLIQFRNGSNLIWYVINL